ncbi:MAG: TetR/AcrR family transcriptional regulator [Cystobacterineae bacterium]|nr:TetR/AcrR family transcriptional regulator [Cystobacterineae bacterium]
MTKPPKPALTSSTEEKIIAAAMEVFIACGYHGARMREIAQKANSNLALLNYYFRSKENLFKTVCSKSIDKLYARLFVSFTTHATLEESIRSLVGVYMDTLLETEGLPLFMLNVLAQHPGLLAEILQEKNFVQGLFPHFFQQVETEIAAGRIRNIQPRELLLNCLALCVFPFIAAPMFKAIFRVQHAEFRELMAQRKTQVAEFILGAICIPKAPSPLCYAPYPLLIPAFPHMRPKDKP